MGLSTADAAGRHSEYCSVVQLFPGPDSTGLQKSSQRTLTDLRYRDETLDLNVSPYTAAIGNESIWMDDKA
ncbi:hypothetical protein TNCV_3855281 [Trichonephila clavipes]|nr:hypothetical protein TNCV_3855281 [Trichonephila clavipes]